MVQLCRDTCISLQERTFQNQDQQGWSQDQQAWTRDRDQQAWSRDQQVPDSQVSLADGKLGTVVVGTQSPSLAAGSEPQES